MTQHESKCCPRCNKDFECKCGSINLCQCMNISLSENFHHQLHEHYGDCLCIACLRELAQIEPPVLSKKLTLNSIQTIILQR
jgi:hypothetical protein